VIPVAEVNNLPRSKHGRILPASPHIAVHAICWRSACVQALCCACYDWTSACVQALTVYSNCSRVGL